MIRVSSFGKNTNPTRDLYVQRIKHAIPFQWDEIAIKKLPEKRPSKLLPEEKKFLENVQGFILLDPQGKQMTSKELSEFCFAGPDRHFVVGPAFGFASEFYDQASLKISLSKLEFTHGLAQAMLAESLYRSVCIQLNHPFVK